MSVKSVCGTRAPQGQASHRGPDLPASGKRKPRELDEWDADLHQLLGLHSAHETVRQRAKPCARCQWFLWG